MRAAGARVSLVAVGLGRQGRRAGGGGVVAACPASSASQVDVDAALVLLGGVVEAELAAEALDAGLELLHAAGRVVALADDDVQMGLACGLGVADARLEDLPGLVDVLAVQVDGVVGDAARRVVLAEDELGRPPVVLGLPPLVPLALLRERLGLGAVAAFIRLVRLSRTPTLLARESAAFVLSSRV